MNFRLCRFAGLALMMLAWALLAHSSTPASNRNIDFDACQRGYETPVDAECGRLLVPENPGRPDGRTISLNIMRVPALGEATGGPIFVIVGGPGGAAVRTARQYLPFFRELQQERDIVFVDQRGTGESNGLGCAFTELQFVQLADDERYRQARQELAACLAALDADLRFYTTPYAVRDLERVRQALGYRQVNLWGVSYGTRVILEYMRRYPEVVRTAVLDGVAPVAIQLPRFTEEDASRALEQIFMRCARSTACADAFGNLRSEWLGLLDNLEQEPRQVILSHPRSREPVPVHLSATVLSGWVRLALYSRELAPLMPEAIQRAVANDFSVLGNIALLAVEDITDQVSQGMQMAVLCAEDQGYPSSPEVETPGNQARLLRLDRPDVFRSFCEQLPRSELPEDYFEPVRSEVPTLLLSGEFDPVTPSRWADRVARHLPNSQHLVAPGAHHGVTMHGCAARLVTRFIEVGTVRAVEQDCLNDIQPRAFFIDSAGPAMTVPRGSTEALHD